MWYHGRDSSYSNVTKTTYPDGYFVDRIFDELSRLTDIKLNGAGTSAVQFQFDALSRRTKLVYENGCTTNYAFEVDNDLSSLLHNFVGSNVQFNYSFDNANQMTTHRVSDPANFRWTPPAPSTTTYGTASNINQYPTVGGTAQAYSTDGCLTNDGTFKYEFNSERMMTRVRNAGTNAIIADYLYDPSLRQRQKNVGGVKTNYYYAGFQRLADYDGSAGTPGTLLNRYVYGTGMDDVLIQITAGGTKTYYHQNHQGSVIATTNSSGAVLNRYTYGPFGESAALVGTTHGYTGQRYDSETGLYYFKMRQYSAKLGRFLQPDPIGMAGGMNLYGYLDNAPLQAVDPLGLLSFNLPLSNVKVEITDFTQGLTHILTNHYLVPVPKKGFFYKWALHYGLQKFADFIRDDNIYYRIVKIAALFVAGAALDMAIVLAVSDWAMATTLPVETSGTSSVYVVPYSVVQIAVSSLLGFQLPRLGYDLALLHEANAVRIIKGSGNLITAYPVWIDTLPEVSTQQSSTEGLRLGYAGLGGALQGYTFDVLTRQWVTDYEFFLLAHGWTPAGGSGGTGAGSGSGGGNGAGSGSGK